MVHGVFWKGLCSQRLWAVDRSRSRTAAMPLASTCSEPGRPQALHVDIVTLAMTPNL